MSDSFTIMDQAQSYLTVGYNEDSIIIVTARSLDILRALEITDCLEMPVLEAGEARSLFMHHANLAIQEANKEMIMQHVNRCMFYNGNVSSLHYHPLALIVLGSQVAAGKRNVLAGFNESSSHGHSVFSILRKAFDALSFSDKLLFMDVALSRLSGDHMFQWLSRIHNISVDTVKKKVRVLHSLY